MKPKPNPFLFLPIIAIALLCCGGARLMSPKEKGEMINAPMMRLAAVITEQVKVDWSYPQTLPRPGLMFDVEYRESLRSGAWAKVGQTTQPPFLYTLPSKKSGFFRVLSHSSTLMSTNVALAWDPSPDAVSSYHLLRGPTSGNYTNFIATTKLTATVSNVAARVFFAATALDAGGSESSKSNEIDFTPDTEPVYPVSSLTITKL